MKLEFICLFMLFVKLAYSAVSSQLETCQDEKEFKAMLKTKPNLLILFTKSDTEARDVVKLLKEVNLAIKGTASIAYINCEKLKKVCKKYKVSPNPYELKHFKEGVFNKDYDRRLVKKSMITFLKDPTGDLPWEEDETAKDIIHLKGEAALAKLFKRSKSVLVMFYAPWCGFCKKMKPDYSAAATELKKTPGGAGVLAAANCELTENSAFRRIYNVTGYPTVLYFRDGSLEFPYGGEYTQASIVEWLSDPQPPKEKEKEASWSEDPDMAVTFLNEDNFDAFIDGHANVLVKFYANWCGHCKNMKPVFNRVAKQLKEENSSNVIAFVDAQENSKLAERFKVKGFPTVKFFKEGKFAWEYNERDEAKILEFMRNPIEPPVKQAEPEWKDEESYIIHTESSNFASSIKTKKHALVMFYAPWCGHCKTAKPHFREAAEHFKEDTRVAFVAVDCTKNQATCDQYGVKGFPTMFYFNYGKNQVTYEGGREAKNFIKFMNDPTDPNSMKQDARDDWLEITGQQHVNILDDKTFDSFLQEKKRVLVMFYAPWCGHCTHMKPAYAQAATDLTSFVPGSYMAAVDATKSSKLSERFKLSGFPTLKYFEGGEFKWDYAGARTREALVEFMRNPKAQAHPSPTMQQQPSLNDERLKQHVAAAGAKMEL